MADQSSSTMFGRRTKTILPTTSMCLKPSDNSELKADQTKASNKRIADTVRKNLHRKDLPPLQSGAVVHIQPLTPHQCEWKSGVVTRPLSSRTYEVQTNDGSTLRQNRQFLRSSPTSPHVADTTHTSIDSTPTSQTPTSPSN